MTERQGGTVNCCRDISNVAHRDGLNCDCSIKKEEGRKMNFEIMRETKLSMWGEMGDKKSS